MTLVVSLNPSEGLGLVLGALFPFRSVALLSSLLFSFFPLVFGWPPSSLSLAF